MVTQPSMLSSKSGHHTSKHPSLPHPELVNISDWHALSTPPNVNYTNGSRKPETDRTSPQHPVPKPTASRNTLFLLQSPYLPQQKPMLRSLHSQKWRSFSVKRMRNYYPVAFPPIFHLQALFQLMPALLSSPNDQHTRAATKTPRATARRHPRPTLFDSY